MLFIFIIYIYIIFKFQDYGQNNEYVWISVKN